MKDGIFTFLLTFILGNVLAQTNVLGKYENNTGATEHFGTIIEILPEGISIYYSIKYGTIKKETSGTWKVNVDTLELTWKDKAKEKYIIINENLLSDIVRPAYDTIINNETTKVWTVSNFLVKTTNFYKNGNIESTRTWKSINRNDPELSEEGKWIYYYENGNRKAVGSYKEGNKIGEWTYYAEDGSRKTVNE